MKARMKRFTDRRRDLHQVGRYVLGNFLTSVIASIGGRLDKGFLR